MKKLILFLLSWCSVCFGAEQDPLDRAVQVTTDKLTSNYFQGLTFTNDIQSGSYRPHELNDWTFTLEGRTIGTVSQIVSNRFYAEYWSNKFQELKYDYNRDTDANLSRMWRTQKLWWHDKYYLLKDWVDLQTNLTKMTRVGVFPFELSTNYNQVQMVIESSTFAYQLKLGQSAFWPAWPLPENVEAVIWRGHDWRTDSPYRSDVTTNQSEIAAALITAKEILKR